MIQGAGLLARGLRAFVVSIVSVLAIRWVAVSVLDLPTEFPPLAGPGPTIFFTAVGALGAIGVYALLRRRLDRPEVPFRLIAVVVLLASFLPDVWLLGEGAAEAFPGTTPAGVGVLMLMHVAAAV